MRLALIKGMTIQTISQTRKRRYTRSYWFHFNVFPTLQVERDKLPTFGDIPYLLLVAEMDGVTGRKMVRVLVSQHRGYIFIQTDQPIYNPTQQGTSTVYMK